MDACGQYATLNLILEAVLAEQPMTAGTVKSHVAKMRGVRVTYEVRVVKFAKGASPLMI